MTAKEKSVVGKWGVFGKVGIKFLAYLPKLLKFTKLIKFGLLAISFASYAYLFTWKFAVLILVSLAFHEQSHCVAMRIKGIPTKGWYAIPFLGGAAIAEEAYKTYADNAFVALAGPIGGLLLAIATYVGYLATGLPLLAAAACWMAFLNLFNLAPISMLDGGQVVRSIAISIHENVGIAFMFVSSIACIMLLFAFHIGLMAFIATLGALDLLCLYLARREEKRNMERWEANKQRWHNRFDAEHERIFGSKSIYGVPPPETKKRPTDMNTRQFIMTIAGYVLTAVALIVIMQLTKNIPGADIAANFMADK